MPEAPFQILLYYLYAPLRDAQGYREEHAALCERLGLRGRIIIAAEGVNGTVSGSVEATAEYMRFLKADQRTAGIEFKVDEAEEHAFPRAERETAGRSGDPGTGSEEDFSPCGSDG